MNLNLSNPNVEQAVIKYEHFINNVLKEDLHQLELNLTQINTELTDLYQQKHVLKVVTDNKIHPTGFKSQVNLGCNFFMEASVTDVSSLLMNIGLKHYLEFSLEEANKYLDIRIEAFDNKSKELREKASQIKAHIKLMLLGISELQSVSS